MENGDIEEIKARLSRLEEEVFGMNYETANAVLNSYLEAMEEKPYISESPCVLRAEKMLGV